MTTSRCRGWQRRAGGRERVEERDERCSSAGSTALDARSNVWKDLGLGPHGHGESRVRNA